MCHDHEPPVCSVAANARDAAAHARHHRGRSSADILDRAVILRRLAVAAGQTILDAGCGNGYMTREFAQLVGATGAVYALDPDEIAIAALRAETEDANIQALVGDITATTPLPPASCDLVYLSMVFHGFSRPQIESFEREVQRLLKPQGRLAIVEIAKRDTPFGPPLDLRFSPEELIQALHLSPQAVVDVGEHCYMQLFQKGKC